MTTETGFLLYAALYRLTVLAVGALSIWLGFRLFSNASKNNDAANGSGSASAEGGGFKLAFTNLLPGTYFALFGTVIISVMLWKGEPQFLQQELIGVTEKDKAAPTIPASNDGTVPSNAAETVSRTRTLLAMRGNDKSKSDADIAWEQLNAKVTLAEAAGPLSAIARSWQQEGKRIGEAVAMARLAAKYGREEDQASYFDLLAELLLANGDEGKAVDALQNAAQRDPLYRSKLTQMEDRIGKEKK